MSRLALFILVVLWSAWPAAAQSADPPAREEASPTTVTSTGITIVRGGTTRAPAPAPEGPAEDEAAQDPDAPEESAEAPDEPKARRVSTNVIGVGGDPLGTSPTVQEVRTEDGGSRRVVRTTSPNGREVVAVEETEDVSEDPGGVKVRENRIQRYGPNGEPAGQEVVRSEERTLPDGTVETTSVRYEQDLNGRMQPVERTVSREKTVGATTTTTTTTEAPNVNGRFAPITREESVERKQGEAATVTETTRMASEGGRMVVVGKEESTARSAGPVETTETQVWERGGATGSLSLVSRSVGEKSEAPDGAVSERVETYSFGVGRTRNPNATRMELNKVVNRTVSVGSGGVQQERIETRERSLNGSDEFSAPTIVQKTTTPTEGGETVRTEVREPTTNGRIAPVSVTVEQIEK